MSESGRPVILNKSRLMANALPGQGRRVRRDLLSIVEQVMRAIDPFDLTRDNLTLRNDHLLVAKQLTLDLSRYRNTYVLGAGKAVYKMALAVERVLASRVTDGWINIPATPETNELKRVRINVARHPTPDRAGVHGSKQIRSKLERAGRDDLVIAVISGGGSALMPLPAEGITLSDKIRLTSLLLKSPATIHEINTVRKHLSAIKGGQFARYAHPATVVALYVSDIVGDRFDVQASGPTAPDPSTFAEAVGILKKHGIWKDAPSSVRGRLLHGVKGVIQETPKAGDVVFRKGHVHNFTIANHYSSCAAAATRGRRLGYQVLAVTSLLQGEAREVAKVIVAIGEQVQRYDEPIGKPALIIASGEPTVDVRGSGKGGRMQEFALAALLQMKEGMTLAALGTDGVDGITPTPVAGVIAEAGSKARGEAMGLDVHSYLADNNSYEYFRRVGGRILTGPTGTNVGDLILLAVY